MAAVASAVPEDRCGPAGIDELGKALGAETSDDLHEGWSLASGLDSQSALDDALRSQGFHMFNRFLSPLHLQQLCAAFDERLAGTKDPGQELDLGCNWADATVEPFLRVLLDDRLVAMLASICGLPFVALRLELFGKGPHSSTEIPFHQDTYTTHTGFTWTAETAAAGERPHPITLWVALDDVSCENGGMEMVPGRHRELLNDLHPSRMAVPEDVILEDPHVEYRLTAGQAGFHHPLAPHRSCRNSTDRPRRAFLVRFSPWTEKLQQQCGDPVHARARAAAQGWPEFLSKPSSRYVWVPGNKQALASKSLNRVLVCCPTSQ